MMRTGTELRINEHFLRMLRLISSGYGRLRSHHFQHLRNDKLLCFYRETLFGIGALQKELPFARDNTSIRVFRHALALDEHRANFLPNFYHNKQTLPISRPKISEAIPAPASSAASVNEASLIDVSIPEIAPTTKPHKKAIEYPKKDRSAPTDVCEVWFAGCHSGKLKVIQS